MSYLLVVLFLLPSLAVPVHAASVDLTVDNVWLEKAADPGQAVASVAPGEQFNIVASVKNIGDSTGSGYYLDVYYDSDYGRGGPDNIASGEVQVWYVGPLTAQAGSHTTKWIIDPDNQIAEVSENNNEKDLTFTLGASQTQNATLALTPTSGRVGTIVSAYGLNYQGTTCQLISSPSGLFSSQVCSIVAGALAGNFTVDSGATSQNYTVIVQTDASDSAANTFTVLQEYSVTFYSDPISGIVTVDGATKTNNQTQSGYSIGQRVHVVASPPSDYRFSGWEASGVSVDNSTSQDTYMTVSGDGWLKVHFAINGYTITVLARKADGSALSGVQVTFGSQNKTTDSSGNAQFPTSSGTYSLTLQYSVSGGPGVQYVFAQWSDGDTANTKSIAVSGSTTYDVTYKTQYQLTMQANPPSSDTVSPSLGAYWYDSGSSIMISATANSSYAFSSWSGSGSGSYTGSSNSSNVTMNGPITETANFGQYVMVTIQLSAVTSDALGTVIVIDGTGYMYAQAPQSLSWIQGSTHTVSASSPVSCDAGCQYVWASWSDAGAQSHQITAPTAPTTYTGTFKKQYQLTISANPPSAGSTNPAVGSYWYDSGQTVSIQAIPASGYKLRSWGGSGSGSYTGTTNPASVTVNGPLNETATLVTATNAPPAISGLTPDKASGTQVAGSMVTWICSASDADNDTISYRFFVRPSGGSWSMVQDWSTVNTWTWAPATARSYDVACHVRDGKHQGPSGWDDHKEAYGYSVLSAPPNNAPVISGLSPDKASGSQVVGSAITWTCSATDAEGDSISYRFFVRSSGGSWSVARDWSSSATWSWTPTTARSYDVACHVRDGKHQGPSGWDDHKEAYGYSVLSAPPNNPPAISSLVPDKVSGSQVVGTAILWTCSASDAESDPIVFRFFVRAGGRSWSVVQDWSSSNSYAWTPTGAGTYDVACHVRDGKHAGANGWDDHREAYGYVVLSAPPNNPPVISSLSPDKASGSQIAGSTVTWTCSATDAENDPIVFRFFVRLGGGSWSVVQDWSASDTWSWTPASAGSYDVACHVRDGKHQGPTGWDDHKEAYSYSVALGTITGSWLSGLVMCGGQSHGIRGPSQIVQTSELILHQRTDL